MNSLGERMKRYELTSKSYLLRRAPVIVRIDGKSFHTLTKNFKRPFDKVFMTAMDLTMQDLCKKVQGCVFGYTQSDEITLFLCDYKELNTDAYFDYNVQKLTSVIASMATCSFIIHLTQLAAIEFMPNLFGENKPASITEEQFKNYKYTKNTQENRNIGWIAERLTFVYILALQECYTVKQYPMVNMTADIVIEENPFKRLKNKVYIK